MMAMEKRDSGNHDRRRRTRRRSRSRQQHADEKRPTVSLCSIQYCFFSTLVALLVATAIIAGSIFFYGTANPLQYFFPVDPPGAREALRWDATAGLHLTVENACTDAYTNYFDQSVMEWNQSDALILTSIRTQHDYDCMPVRGRLKVCNGDYGDTDWLGVNGAVVDVESGNIIESISKLNDYHLLNRPLDILYTMCHENGHGFGLPHSDENHFNRDRGDCMDYTNNPAANLVPGQYNLDLLEDLYGTPNDPLDEEDLKTMTAMAATTITSSDTPAETLFVTTIDEKPLIEDANDQSKDKASNAENMYENEVKKRLRRRRKMAAESNRDFITNGNDSLSLLQRSIQVAMDICEKEYCLFDVDQRYRIQIHRLLVVVD